MVNSVLAYLTYNYQFGNFFFQYLLIYFLFIKNKQAHTFFKKICTCFNYCKPFNIYVYCYLFKLISNKCLI